MRSCNELCNYFLNKEWNIIGSKTPHYNKLGALLRRVFPNYISFTSLTSASQKTCAFYVNELSIGPRMCYTRHVSVIQFTDLPFDQMEPSCSMQTRSGNPVRTPKSERDFPDFWIEFYAEFYEWVNDRLMMNFYKQYFTSSGVYFLTISNLL